MKRVRILAMVLCAAIVCCFFSACNPQKDPENDPGTPSDSTKIDFNGYKFYFRGSFIPKTARDYTEEEAAIYADNPPVYSVEDQAMMDNVLNVETDYNCQVKIGGFEWMQFASLTDFCALYESGEMPTHILYGEIGSGRELYQSGYLVDLKTLTKLDYTDSAKWGSAASQTLTTYKDALFGFPTIGSNYMPFAKRYNGVFLLNNNLYASFNVDSTPRELDEAKDWTFATFADILPQVTNADYRNQVFGLVSNGLMFVSCAVLANGGDRVVYDDAQGKYVFGWTRPEAVKALEWASGILSNVDLMAQSAAPSTFWSNMATFAIVDGYRAFGSTDSDIPPNMDNYSWVPFPYGPDVEYGSVAPAYQTTEAESFTGIMADKNPEVTENSAFIMDKIFAPTEQFGTEGYNEFLMRYFFEEGDTYSFNVYLKQKESYTTDYTYALGKTSVTLGSISNQLTAGENTLDVILDRYESAINDQLDITMNSED